MPVVLKILEELASLPQHCSCDWLNDMEATVVPSGKQPRREAETKSTLKTTPQAVSKAWHRNNALGHPVHSGMTRKLELVSPLGFALVVGKSSVASGDRGGKRRFR